jgi:hypothetical protein
MWQKYRMSHHALLCSFRKHPVYLLNAHWECKPENNPQLDNKIYLYHHRSLVPRLHSRCNRVGILGLRMQALILLKEKIRNKSELSKI